MRAQRLPLRLLLPIGLMLLVILLGALQYRWLGQVSEAERAQLQRSLAQRASEFGQEFDREILLAYELLTIDGSALDADPWSALSARYDIWRQRAAFPGLVRALYIARPSDAGHTLARWSPDTRSGEGVTWPDHFGAVQRAISMSIPRTMPASAPVSSPAAAGGTVVRGGTVFTMSVSPVVDSVPALVVPIVTHAKNLDTGLDLMVALRMAGTDFVVVELDRQVLTESLIPSLVERYFPGDDANQYRVGIVDRGHEYMYQRGLDELAEGQRLHVDAASTFFTGSRFQFNARMLTESRALTWQVETMRRSSTSGAVNAVGVATGASITTPQVIAEPARQVFPLSPSAGNVSVMLEQATAPTAQAVRVSLPGWQIMLQHRAGSLDEAVAQARLRNLTTSFGILGVLVIGMGLIVVNARKSERLAAKQMEFVATVSHELRTPLAVIRSAAQNLSAGVVEDPDQAKRYGDLIETEGRRLTDMVEEVLEFAGLSGNRRALALRPVDLAWLAKDVVENQATTLSAGGLDVELQADDDLPLVMADEEAIRRALNNLVGNAAKYASEGRWLGVRVAQRHIDGRDEVTVAVSDRGPGIAAEDLPHIFEPFYRGRAVVERQIHGNGLGLCLVSRIAEAHGGGIDVSSSPGSGTTFTLRLPAAPADVA